MSASISSVRPAPDQVLVDVADYVTGFRIESAEAYQTAHYCLLDTLGCMEAAHAERVKHAEEIGVNLKGSE